MARQNLRKDHAPGRRFHALGFGLAVVVDGTVTRLDFRMQGYGSGVEGLLNLARIGERHVFAGRPIGLQGQVVKPQHDILRRHDDWFSAGRAEDVVGRHHQHPRLELCLQRQRNVDRHLVAVEIGIERRAHERMELNRLAFDEHWLERLDAKPVKRRSAVEKHRVLADDLLEDIPDLGALLLHHASRRLDRGGHAIEFELRIDERLEQFERHLLG